MKKNICLGFLFLLLTTLLFSQGAFSKQGHKGNVTNIVYSNNYFYSAGSDGFVIRWNSKGEGEHYQVSSIEIKMLAVHPEKAEIAVYETDGFSVYRLSVWDWNQRKLKYSSRFTDSITSLSYSGKGNYLITGTSSVDGLFFLDSNTGKPVPILNDQISATTLVKTNNKETTCVIYSPSGSLYYADIKTGNEKANIDCTPYLENPLLFANNAFLAGHYYAGIEIVNAMDGSVLSTIETSNTPLFLSNTTDKDLHYIEYNSQTKNYELKTVFTGKSELNYEPVIVKKFKLENKNEISCATKIGNNIFIGDTKGNLYNILTKADTKVVSLSPFTSKSYNSVIDIAEHNGTFLLLTNDNILASTYTEGTSTEITKNNGFNRINSCGERIILWTYNEKESVYMLNDEGNFTEIFSPVKALHTVTYQDNKLIFIEGNSTISLYDFEKNTVEKLYNGTGIQDALLFEQNNNSYLIIAKTASSNPKSALLSMDMNTKETVPLNINAEVVFALCLNPSEKTKTKFYGISSTFEGNKKKTEIFTYNLDSKTYSPISYWNDEDTSAFINIYKNAIYTNIGKTNIRSLNLSTKKEFVFPRTFALAEKITVNKDTTLVLNKDGSLSWFNSSNRFLGAWFYGLDGSFIEISD